MDPTAELDNEIEEEWPRLTQFGFRPQHGGGDVAPAQGNFATLLHCHCAMPYLFQQLQLTLRPGQM